MALDWAGFQNFVTTFGSILGIVSFIFVVDRWMREKPILNFTLGPNYFSKDHKRFYITVEIHIDNTGERGTSIKGIELVSLSNQDLFEQIYDQATQNFGYIQPHSSQSISWARARGQQLHT